MKNGRASGYISLTLHAHLPWVIHHGTWPHGLEWLLEAAAESYLPLLRVLKNLERDGLALKANVSVSPVLLEQLAHPVFQAEFPAYLKRKILAAEDDEACFRRCGEVHFAEAAHHWRTLFERTAEEFEALDRNIVSGFRYFQNAGLIEIVTCGATHGYLPLLGTDESVLAQVKTGVATHRKHLGRQPRGMCIPECGSPAAGIPHTPAIANGNNPLRSAFPRMRVGEALAASGIEHFFVDGRIVEKTSSSRDGAGQAASEAVLPSGNDTLYRAYLVQGPPAHGRPIAAFPGDLQTGRHVWSGSSGYPTDGSYLDFHRKRWPGGLRYWQITQPRADLSEKAPYQRERAWERAKAHAGHFVEMTCAALKNRLDDPNPPVLTIPFDAEIFGHWWFEGPDWLEQVARLVSKEDFPLALISGAEYLERHPAQDYPPLAEGSLGKNGNNETWLNPSTTWTWTRIYPAEEKVRAIASEGRWRDSGMGERIAKQLCRELLLLETSDWQSLITTEASRDYAEQRFLTHLDQFRDVSRTWEEFTTTGMLSAETERRLTQIEQRDNLFAEVDPELWATHSGRC